MKIKKNIIFENIYLNLSQEQKIIKQTLREFGADDENLEEILKNGEKIENDSVQILDFTREIKNMNRENKVKIIETLWRIIYSNKEADMYETNLMRRLGGLLYIDSKLMGDIKNKIKKEILPDTLIEEEQFE